ncbi:MAG TPA: hypothetical protein VLC09_07375, partial [Polyangiaceae bacterium]|nr:hypothetical protein [Polyangiaceae bacterium]
MDKSQKDSTTRPRRPRSVPPPESLEVGFDLPGLRLCSVSFRRFRGQHAPLAALAAQLRSADAVQDVERAAVTAGRLARQLSRRQSELREVLALAEKSLGAVQDPSLSEDVAGWWALAGDLSRGAALLQGLADGRSANERSALYRRAGEWLARSSKPNQAAVAFERAAQERDADARALELLGGLGFWARLEDSRAASAYLAAAERRAARGEDALAFEDHLRAFEVDPTYAPAAEELARVLVARGRSGAAEDVLREHLRLGPAARRIAHYQRRFIAALERGDYASALGDGLEAELDIELDPERLREVLTDPDLPPQDFEGLLVHLARSGALGERGAFARWLGTLVELHASDWGEAVLGGLFALLGMSLGLSRDSALPVPSAARVQELRRRLVGDLSPTERAVDALSVARGEVSRGDFVAALEVIGPSLLDAAETPGLGALAALVAGRTRAELERALALAALAHDLPDAACAEVAALAAEGLVACGAIGEARAAAEMAFAAGPSLERAASARALVALRDPEEASQGQLEVSLSVLVARAETCVVLGRAAERRGALRLAFGWAERALGLRPADPALATEFLRLAMAVGDGELLSEAALTVLREPLPLAEIAVPLAHALRGLAEHDAARAVQVARKLLDVAARSEECRQAVLDVAQRANAPELLAQMLERELVLASASARPELLLDIASARFLAGEFSSAARAARRALALGAEAERVGALIERMPVEIEPDGLVAVREAESEVFSRLHPERRQERADRLWGLGVLRWDTAEDTVGAVLAFQEAAELDTEDGLGKMAYCLTAVAGSEEAARVLEVESRETESPERSARLLGLAARCMVDVGEEAEAFRLARLALDRAPRMTEFLTIVERTGSAEQIDELTKTYEHLAQNALGCYAERALRYRAARQLERRGALEAALQQAIGAFQAVPAEGVAFILMARVADRIERGADVVAALERVASRVSNKEERARWLEKA